MVSAAERTPYTKIISITLSVTVAITGALWTLTRELMIRPTATHVSAMLEDARIEIRRELESAQQVQAAWIEGLRGRQDELSSKLDAVLHAVQSSRDD